MSIEKTLFAAADRMRGAMDPGEYKYIALGLIFLRYVSVAFERLHAELEADPDSDANDKDEYVGKRVFWVPENARWSFLVANAREANIGSVIDEAMRAIEAENPSIQGSLPKSYGRDSLHPEMLTGLIALFTNGLRLEGNAGDFDLIGRVYEYCISEFASAEGKRGGEFYTPQSMVHTLVEMIEPTNGRVYDPCCGTGGFFVQSERFITAHAGNRDQISIFGQERNPTTVGLARMNMAIRGISANIAWNPQGTLVRDAFPDERFDYILANPPFNISDWSGEHLQEDQRWQFGKPPVGNANFAWIQHIYARLSANGVAGVVLANGSLSSMSGGEGDIRKALVEANAVDAIVSLPNQLFYGTQIPACLWILAKNKANGVAGETPLRDRRGEVLFIDARNMGALVPGSRKQKELSPDEMALIAQTYHAWRGEPDAGEYADVAGFCKASSLENIQTHQYILTPGRYIGTEKMEVEGLGFSEKYLLLKNSLQQGIEEGKVLDNAILLQFERFL